MEYGGVIHEVGDQVSRVYCYDCRRMVWDLSRVDRPYGELYCCGKIRYRWDTGFKSIMSVKDIETYDDQTKALKGLRERLDEWK